MVRVRHLLEKTRPEDIAHIFPALRKRERRQLFDLIEYSADQAEVLAELESGLIPEILDALSVEKAVEILHEVPADDVADILAELDDERAAAILDRMQEQDSLEVEDLMGYDPESAGGIMSPDFFALHKDTTVKDAIVALQEKHHDLEMAFYVYVINEHDQLTGVVSLRQLVTTHPTTQLNDIAEHDTISVEANADQENVAQLVARYNFLALPVVDEANKLLGIVTVDDIIDVLYDEATEDILKLAGAGTELPITATVWDHLKMRYPWLIASCFGGFVAAMIMGPFMSLPGSAFLLLFVPVVMGMAGNVGIQSSTIVVRGLATGHVELSKVGSVIRREISLGFLLGGGYGIVVGIGVALYGHFVGTGQYEFSIAFFGVSVGLSLTVAMIIAATLGTLIPLGFNRVGVDPAVATGPFVTTALDVLGILAYFIIALLLARVF
jgi:magnesium transporter